TTYLERWDCISMLDRPISDPDAAADSIRQPVVEPDRDVRPFQSVLIDIGARLGLPGFVTLDGKPKFPGGYADYIVNHERAPGIGPLAGYRGKDGKAYGKGEVNPKQLEQYIAGGAFHQHHFSDDQRFYKHANKAYLEWAKGAGFIGNTDPIIFQLYLEPLQKFRLAARGHGAVQPPDSHRARIERYFDPIPSYYSVLDAPRMAAGSPEGVRHVPPKEYPLYAITQRPMHMYHSWGSQNAWLRQITAENRLYVHRDLAAEKNIADDDWVWLASPLGRIKCQVRLMDGVNRETVWTWNAVGKRSGAWALDKDAPESKRGFLLNHLIAELLPEREGGYRFSNSDPITGQAAWYDLRVALEKCAEGEAEESEPRFERLVFSTPSVKP
ncbi:MAG: molybdopterin oxidoreductase family protein, partial [Hyphomicrobiaceae bacterium]